LNAKVGRFPHNHPNTNFEQPRVLFNKVFSEQDRKDVIANISGSLAPCRQDIKERVVKHFYKVDPRYGSEIAKNVGVSIDVAKM
jgi:catalase